jgi:uncharacterized protein with FMN-binding domain
MRRALIATAGTAAALVAILQYKSSGTVKIGGGQLVPTAASPTTASPTASPTTTAPSHGSSSTGSSSATSPSTTIPPTTKPAGKSGQFTGTDVTYQYGEMQARLTVQNGRITAVTYPIESAPDPRSEFINSQALPILTRELLSAQNLRIDSVSGATYTSNAFAQTVQAALSKAGMSSG